MNFAVDLGNTNSKLGVFKQDQLIDHLELSGDQNIIDYINRNSPGRLIIGSVRKNVGGFVQKLKLNGRCFVLDHQTPIPINIKYKTPESLGVDRIALAVGAADQIPNNDCLVIDVGTCITYDFVDKQGNYWGGAISPGVGIKFRSLNTYTANLPLVEIKKQPELIGQNTAESIQSGVVNGTLAEIESLIELFNERAGELKVILTGGDASLFASRIKATNRVIPELVLIGLNRILLYNER